MSDHAYLPLSVVVGVTPSARFFCVVPAMCKSMVALLLILSSQSVALDTVKCSAEAELFVRKLYSAKRLSAETLVAGEEKNSQIKQMSWCVIERDLMMDGLSFTLYQSIKNEAAFIRVHNDFVGTSELYGPFK